MPFGLTEDLDRYQSVDQSEMTRISHAGSLSNPLHEYEGTIHK